MCGIVGYITTGHDKYIASREHYLKYALIMDTIRGADSTGLIEVRHKFQVDAMRSVLPGHDFINTDLFLKREQDAWCAIGHNRAATRGNVKVENAHPFYFGEVCLVHNGTLSHRGANFDSFEPSLEVDSMQIALALSKAEPEDATRILSDIDGSFAVVWTDERDESINMARNQDRPLHYTWNKEQDFLSFMSDGLMLTTIQKSLGYAQARGSTIYSVDAMRHLKWKKGSLEPEVSDFVPFVRSYPSYNASQKGSNPLLETSKTSGGNTLMNAAQRAQDKWRNAPRYHGEVSSLSGLSEKVHIAGRNRDIPKGHVAAIEGFFGLRTADRLCFKPDHSYEMLPKTLMVTGNVYMPHWGNCEWEAVVLDVPLVSYNAYGGGRWLVRPIGITRRIDGDNKNLPAVLCQLIHCDWDKWDGQQFEDSIPFEEDTKEEAQDDPKVEDTIRGVGGVFMPIQFLRDLLQDGCVMCGSPLWEHSANDYMAVNEGRDVLCDTCAWETDHGYKH